MSDNAIRNAAAWLETICEKMAAKDAAQNEKRWADADLLQEEISEQPLSVDVRTGWYTPGTNGEPAEYQILLSTGGPALRIHGELGQYNQPSSAELQWQDWGTPWTPYTETSLEQDETLLSYACCHYFGEN